MIVTLGSRAAPTTALTWLTDCHERIRRFGHLLERVAADATLTLPQRAEASRQAERYFREALVLHVADEEQSVLPRLRGVDAAVDVALEQMVQQHQAHAPLLREVLVLAAQLGANPQDEAARAALAPLAKRLRAELEEHLAQEERTWFPLVAAWSAAEQQAVVRELRQRRDLALASAPR